MRDKIKLRGEIVVKAKVLGRSFGKRAVNDTRWRQRGFNQRPLALLEMQVLLAFTLTKRQYSSTGDWLE